MAGAKGRSGGARKGGGRKKSDQPRKPTLSLTLSPETKERLEQHVPAGSRSEWIEQAIIRQLAFEAQPIMIRGHFHQLPGDSENAENAES